MSMTCRQRGFGVYGSRAGAQSLAKPDGIVGSKCLKRAKCVENERCFEPHVSFEKQSNRCTYKFAGEGGEFCASCGDVVKLVAKPGLKVWVKHENGVCKIYIDLVES